MQKANAFGGFLVLCRIIPTDSIPENANFGLQCPNVQVIELFENVNFVTDRFTKLHYLTLRFRFYTIDLLAIDC